MALQKPQAWTLTRPQALCSLAVLLAQTLVAFQSHLVQMFSHTSSIPEHLTLHAQMLSSSDSPRLQNLITATSLLRRQQTTLRGACLAL